jgi:hypothetical protein
MISLIGQDRCRGRRGSRSFVVEIDLTVRSRATRVTAQGRIELVVSSAAAAGIAR